MQNKINEFVAALNAKFPKVEIYDNKFVVTEGKKFFKVCTENNTGGLSAYAFVDKETGNLFKPASFAAPTKHARGNINDETGLAACGKFGVAYLRKGW